MAAQLMRYILVDHLRAKSADKRKREPVTISEPADDSTPTVGTRISILDVNDALEELAKRDPEKARIVELRFFAGLSLEETAEARGISIATVKRHWVFSKAWMLKWLTDRGSLSLGLV